jgi:hypothetical protein
MLTFPKVCFASRVDKGHRFPPIALGYRRNVNKVLGGSIVEKDTFVVLGEGKL